MTSGDSDQSAEVLAALEAAIELALAAGFDGDQIIDTVGAMVYPAGTPAASSTSDSAVIDYCGQCESRRVHDVIGRFSRKLRCVACGWIQQIA